jgi:hypothetical protein
MKNFERLADYLDDNARSELDNEAAALLRKLGRVADVAHELVWAKTHDRRNATYCEMIDLIKGKAD